MPYYLIQICASVFWWQSKLYKILLLCQYAQQYFVAFWLIAQKNPQYLCYFFNSVILLLLVKLFHIVNHSVQKAQHHVKLFLRKAFVHGFLYYHYIFPHPVFVVQCFFRQLNPLKPCIILHRCANDIAVFFKTFKHICHCGSWQMKLCFDILLKYILVLIIHYISNHHTLDSRYTFCFTAPFSVKISVYAPSDAVYLVY